MKRRDFIKLLGLASMPGASMLDAVLPDEIVDGTSYVYNCTTPFDLSTMTYARKIFVNSDTSGLIFNKKGTVVYIVASN